MARRIATRPTATPSQARRFTTRACPSCGSRDVVRIIYGLPGPDILDDAEAGKLHIGGCVIDGNEPDRHCKACGRDFRRDAVSAAARGGGALEAPRPRVQLRILGSSVPKHLLQAAKGRWEALPDKLSVGDLGHVAHMIDGYAVAETYLGCNAFDIAHRLSERRRETGRWEGSALELLAGFFADVRGWRGLSEGPFDGDENHRRAQGIYEALRQRLVDRPDEVELLPAPSPRRRSPAGKGAAKTGTHRAEGTPKRRPSR